MVFEMFFFLSQIVNHKHPNFEEWSSAQCWRWYCSRLQISDGFKLWVWAFEFSIIMIHLYFQFSCFIIAVYFNFCKSKITSNSVHANSDGEGTRINSDFRKSRKTIVSTYLLNPFFGQKFRLPVPDNNPISDSTSTRSVTIVANILQVERTGFHKISLLSLLQMFPVQHWALEVAWMLPTLKKVCSMYIHTNLSR